VPSAPRSSSRQGGLEILRGVSNEAVLVCTYQNEARGHLTCDTSEKAPGLRSGRMCRRRDPETMGVGRVVPGNEAAETWNRTVPCSGRYWYDRCKRLACMYLRGAEVVNGAPWK
jgi:hypothetical protein